MDCSRYSDNVKALWSIAAFNEDTSSLSKLTVNLAYKMCLSLRDSRVCSKVEANELRGLFEERFSYSYMKDKRGRTVVFLFFWEKVAYEFIRYIILMSENLTNSFPNCCRYTRTCSDDCIWHQLLEHFRDSMFYSKKLLYIHSVSGKNSLIISYNTTCPICATLKEFTAEDDFVYFPDCHHFICQACAFKMLSKVIMKCPLCNENRVTFCRNFLTEIFKREEWTLVKDILNIVERRWSPDESADEIENI